MQLDLLREEEGDGQPEESLNPEQIEEAIGILARLIVKAHAATKITEENDHGQ